MENSKWFSGLLSKEPRLEENALFKPRDAEFIRQELKRGDIYEYKTQNGEERFALVVSADWRSLENVVSIIVLQEEYTNDKCVAISCRGIKYADCKKVCYAWQGKIGDFVKVAYDSEMEEVSQYIAECLGIKSEEAIAEHVEAEIVEEPVASPPALPLETANELSTLQQENIVLKIRLETIENLYKELIAESMKR